MRQRASNGQLEQAIALLINSQANLVNTQTSFLVEHVNESCCFFQKSQMFGRMMMLLRLATK